MDNPVEEVPMVAFTIGNDSSPSYHMKNIISPFDDIPEETPLLMQPVEAPQQATRDWSDSAEDTATDQNTKQFAANLYEIKHDGTWDKVSRHIHYEETCEGYDHHLGKPHVSCLMMESYNDLKTIASKAVIVRDLIYDSFDEFTEEVGEKVVDPEIPTLGVTVKRMITQHKTKFEELQKHNRSLSSKSLNPAVSADPSPRKLQNMMSVPADMSALEHQQHQERHHHHHRNMVKGLTSAISQRFPTILTTHVLHNEETEGKKEEIVLFDESSMVLVGQIEGMDLCRLVMLRFFEASVITPLFGDAKVKHMFFIIGPAVPNMRYIDIGRALATIISVPHFSSALDSLKTSARLIRTIDRFLEETVVVAPGLIDSKHLIPGESIRKMANLRAQKAEQRAEREHATARDAEEQMEAKKEPKTKPPREKWGLFSGLMDDINNRSKYYKSDWTDFLNSQCCASVGFMALGTLVPTVTFGALLGSYTDNAMGAYETLISQGMSGIVWSFLGGQPLMILSATGPFLVFEVALYELCDINIMPFFKIRFWTGTFVLIYTTITVAFNGCRLLRFVTRFTEDIFSALISLIFFTEAWKYFTHEWDMNPAKGAEYYINEFTTCQNNTNAIESGTLECVFSNPNSYLLSIMNTVGVFSLAMVFTKIRGSRWFGRRFRTICGDFGVFFSLVIVTALTAYLFPHVILQTLDIPNTIDFTQRVTRGHYILIDPRTTDLRVYGVAAIAGALVFILMFVETGITEHILCRKERKMKKGGAVHYDLLLMAIIIFVESAFGLPWMCAAAVQSMAHAGSLTVFEKKAPGEKPKPVRVLEQRGTNLCLSIINIIMSYSGGYIHVSTASLMGVFFYLGVRNLQGNQLLQRLLNLLRSPKHRGTAAWLDELSTCRINIFTFIQFIFLGGIFYLKMIKGASLLFPLVLIFFVFFRQAVIPCFYSKTELDAIDGDGDDETEVDPEERWDECYNVRIPV